MNIWLNLLITTGLGAVIGGYTNHVAIQMLFRPHHPVYIGKYRVPFTPGLIPKRRHELARQMGRMVVEHLLTPEGIGKRLQNEAFQTEITAWTQGEVQKVLETDRTVRDVLELIGVTGAEQKGTAAAEKWLGDKLDATLSSYGDRTVQELLPADTAAKLESSLPKLADFIIGKGVQYFESEDGKRRVGRMLDEFFASRGALLNLVGMFFGNDSLAERIQPEIVKFLRQEGAKRLLVEVLEKEWQRLQQRKAGELEQFISREAIQKAVLQAVQVEEHIARLLDRRVADLLAPYAERVLHELVPKLIRNVFSWVQTHLATVLQRLHLSDIVEGEVAAFSTERLEDLILSIMKSELKAITYLGALLGGLIGVVQGIVMQFLS